MITLGQLQQKRAEILHIAGKHGASNLRVFGSVARGETTVDSDIDLLVTKGEETSAWFPAGMVVELQELLNCSIDIVTDTGINPLLRDYILAEAIPL